MTTYEISVKGHLGQGVIADLALSEVAREPAVTVLRHELGDDEELHDVLDRLSAFGLQLMEVRQVEPGG